MPAATRTPDQTRRLIREARAAVARPGAEALAVLLRAAFLVCGGRRDLLGARERAILPEAERLGACEAEQLGHVYEGLRDQAGRRASAAFYTPARITRPLVRHALEPLAYEGPRQGMPRRRWRLRPADELLSLRVADPAVGGGAFLVAACRYLAGRLLEAWGCPPSDETMAARARGLVARHCLFGVDEDPLAVEIARLSLWLLAGAEEEPASFLADALRCGDSLSLSWPAAFPAVMARGGFDALLSNPPFGNAISDVPARTKAALRGRYVGLSGTADLSYYFLALTERLARPDGVTGVVLPRAFLTAPAARGLRRSLLAARPPALIWCPDGGRDFADANVRVAALVLGGRLGCMGGARWPMREVVVEGENWWAPLGGGEPGALAPGVRHARGGVLAPGANAPGSPPARLADRFRVMASMTTAMAYDLLPFLTDDRHGDGPRFVTAGLIDPHSCRWGDVPCRYLKRTFAHPRVTPGPGVPPALLRRLQTVRRPKLLVAAAAGPGDRVEAFFDRHGDLTGAVSTLTVLDPDDDAERLRALCDWLNGDEVARRLRDELGAQAMGSGLLTVSKAFLGRLPLPRYGVTAGVSSS